MGFPRQGGDQYEAWSIKRQFEAIILNTLKPVLFYTPSWINKKFGQVKHSSEIFFQSTSKVVRSGNWYGNDTTWRMVLDLNKLFFYYDHTGKLRDIPPKYLSIVDGIISGHKNGPMSPEPLMTGIISAGFNPLALDTICATIMGFDFRKIPLLSNAWSIDHFPLVGFSISDIICQSNVAEWSGSLVHIEQGPHLNFFPHFGWVGHIER